MSKWGSFDFEGLKQLETALKNLGKDEVRIRRVAANALGRRLLRRVIKLSPTGEYPEGSGKVGGTLKKSWRAVGEKSGAGVTIGTDIEYAPYVEYGHRGKYVPSLGKTLHLDTHWTEGQFMLTKAWDETMQEAEPIMQAALDKELKKALGKVADGRGGK